MPQTKQIVETLKQELRKQRITYRQVAKTLALSEASVKRLFSEKSFTLSRLAQICGILNLEIADLVRQMEKNIAFTIKLTLAQEKELVADIKLLLMAHFLMNKLEFMDIIRIYDISETEGVRLLAKLDRMKIIELQPGNRVKLMIGHNFKLIPGGPIEHFYESKIQTEFFSAPFDGKGEYRSFVSGMFSRSDNAELIRKIKHLADDANDLEVDSEPLPLEQRFGCSLIMAIRPWEPKLFADLRRAPNKKVF